jgi:hypothetical protein
MEAWMSFKITTPLETNPIDLAGLIDNDEVPPFARLSPRKAKRRGPPKTIRMTLEQWKAVEDNPIQRNTEKHARTAHHLRKPGFTHDLVHMAELPDGSRYKADGHTRSLIWSRGEGFPPQFVWVTIHYVSDIEDVKALYREFDSRSAVETVGDEMDGALRYMREKEGLEFQSDLLKKKQFAQPMRWACEALLGPAQTEKKTSVDLLVFWKDELITLDKMNPRRALFPAGIIQIALLTLRENDPQNKDFWTLYANNGGRKYGHVRDGVQALTDFVKEQKAAKNLSGRNSTMNLVHTAYALLKRYKAGELVQYVRGIKPDSFKEYLGGLKKKAQVSDAEF